MEERKNKSNKSRSKSPPRSAPPAQPVQPTPAERLRELRERVPAEARRRRIYMLGAMGVCVAIVIAIAGRSPTKAAASLRVPTDPSEVIETLPYSDAPNTKNQGDPRRREIAELKMALAADPQNLRAALRLARLDIQLARERSDPRYLGQAQAVLAPWWNDQGGAPAAVLVLRATIEQSLHDFDAALIHLDRALELAPNDAQAWLTRAVVLTVRARYEEARSSCARVAPLADPLAFVVCETQIDSLTGKAKPAHDRLAAALEATHPSSREEEEWAVSSLGEYAARMGDASLAERHFKRAIELTPDDAYVRGALADLLTDASRFEEAAALLRGREVDDAMLLRLAIAERRGKLSNAASEHTDILATRFDASRARGDVVHRREEARFWLELRDDAPRALALAQANWQVQKEPWDVRVLLASASAARDRGAAAPILMWLDGTKLEDPAIARLASGLR